MEICKSVKQIKVEMFSKHLLYCTWRSMNYRCYSDVHSSFPIYGGSGIEVCREWRWNNPEGFYNFLQNITPRPDNHTLDRTDPYGNYSAENCRWADKRTQQNNLRKETTTESGYLGVVRFSKSKWVAQIYLNGHNIAINLYTDVVEAIAARANVLRIKMEQGDSAALRFIENNKIVTVEGKRFYGRKTSKYYGVSWHKRKGVWRSCLSRRIDGKLKQVYLGEFADEELANQSVLDYLEREKNETCIRY